MSICLERGKTSAHYSDQSCQAHGPTAEGDLIKVLKPQRSKTDYRTVNLLNILTPIRSNYLCSQGVNLVPGPNPKVGLRNVVP